MVWDKNCVTEGVPPHRKERPEQRSVVRNKQQKELIVAEADAVSDPGAVVVVA